MKHEAITALHKDLYKRRKDGYEFRKDGIDNAGEPKYIITLHEMNTFIRALEVAVKAIEVGQSVDDI
jgi:hypothetical protein